MREKTRRDGLDSQSQSLGPVAAFDSEGYTSG